MTARSIHSHAVINERFILLLKQRIAVKYASWNTDERAAILADAVHRALDAFLPDFPREEKVSLRMRLMQQARYQGQFHITWNDIFQQCIELDIGQPAVIEPLAQWVSGRIGKPISPEELVEMLDKQRAHNAGKVVRLEDIKEAGSTVPVSVPVTAPERTGRFSRFSSGVLAAAVMAGMLLVALTLSWPLWPALADHSETAEHTSAYAAESESDSGGESAGEQTLYYTVHYPGMYNELPKHLRYREVDSAALISRLNERDSLLADTPYFNTIMETAKTFNIHPLLMFAITGQEQGFVPRTHPDAEKIANNPFNVFHSWREYNTTIEDSARIAARTIVNLSKDRPDDQHPLQWINRKYAEDPNWWIGVDRLFHFLLEGQGEQE